MSRSLAFRLIPIGYSTVPNSDKTQLNNYLTFNWYREAGLYAPRTKLVEVFVNDSRDPAKLNYNTHYRGTYVLLEKIKIDKNRVDITEIEPLQNSEPEITGGYIWKKDKDGANERKFRTDRGQVLAMVDPADLPRRGVDPGPGWVTDEQKDWLLGHINEFESVLYGADFADPEDGYAKYIDVASWVDTWLLVEMTKNIDGFRLSTYYHKDRGGKIKQGPAWDYNLSLGNANYLRGAYFDGWYGDSIDSVAYPYWDRLFEDPNFEQRVADRWHELRQGIFSTENLLADVDEAVALLSDNNPNLERPGPGEPSNPISRNFDRWGTLNQYLWPNCFFGQGACPRSPLPGNGRPNGYDDYIFIQKWFIEGRTAWMDSQFTDPVSVSPEGGVIDRGTSVTMTAPNGFDVFYTTDGSDPRQPLVIQEEVTLLDSGVMGHVVIPSDGQLMDKCDDGNLLPTADTCFINPNYTLGANGETWTEVTTPIGYDTEDTYDALLGSDIEGLMRNNNSSAYIRLPFDVDEQTKDGATSLTLSVAYDDGFAAYLWWSTLRTPVEIARSNAPGQASQRPINALSFNAAATQTNPDEQAVLYEDFDISSFRSRIRDDQTNYLVIQALNESAGSEDFLFDAKITAQTERVVVSPSVRQYTGPITINENSQIFARGFNDRTDEWTGLTKVNYLVDQPTLVINELNYNPYDPTEAELAVNDQLNNDDFEFVEVRNVGASAANLIGSYFTGFDFTFSNVSLEPGEYGVIVKDVDAFTLRYGNDVNILGEFAAGALNNNGERIRLFDAADGLLFDLTYNDNALWSERADGRGATLQLVDPAFTPGDEANKYYYWEGSTEYGGSPGAAGADSIGVVVNEVLAHTDPPVLQTDTIELLNTTDDPIDIGGWFLSDAAGNLSKFRIPANTIVGPGGYVTFDESDFNADPLDENSFALSGTNGDDVWLTARDTNGNVLFVDDVHFRPSLNGESFGRVPNGAGRLTPMQELTLGAANTEPRVGPVVISEVNYNPGQPTLADLAIFPMLTSGDLEFVEIHNPTSAVC